MLDERLKSVLKSFPRMAFASSGIRKSQLPLIAERTRSRESRIQTSENRSANAAEVTQCGPDVRLANAECVGYSQQFNIVRISRRYLVQQDVPSYK